MKETIILNAKNLLDVDADSRFFASRVLLTYIYEETLSTYARCGIIVNVTLLEPEWEGHVTLEISNTTPLPARIYAHEGLAQVLFLGCDEICETSYADRTGKYMYQQGITTPRA